MLFEEATTPRRQRAGRRARTRRSARDGSSRRKSGDCETNSAARWSTPSRRPRSCKASNEELQAINEELRSATEELETSKEELQSINEELITVNYELKSKIDEPAKINDDLQNLIIVDGHRHGVRRQRHAHQALHAAARNLFNLIATDVGRPLLDITHRLDYDDLAATPSASRPCARSSASDDDGGRRYMVRIPPYRTADDRIDGAVLNFIDVTELRREEQLRANDERLRAVAAGAGADPATRLARRLQAGGASGSSTVKVAQAPGPALRADAPAVRPDAGLGDRQPQAQAAIAGRDIAAALFEDAEDALGVAGLEVDARIADLHHHAIALVARAQVDAALPGRELERVLQQVPEHLLQPRASPADERGAGPPGHLQPPARSFGVGCETSTASRMPPAVDVRSMRSSSFPRDPR